jgi:peptidyl-prolyl cis-trans isomerase D
MLQSIRSRAASWVVKLLFVFLILSFVGFGVENFLLSTRKAPPVAEIGSVTLDQPNFAKLLNVELQRYQQSFGGALDRKQMRELGFVDQAIDRVVTDTLLDLESQRLGLVVSDEMVRSTVAGNPAFADEKGQFDHNKFLGMIARSNYGSEERFVNELRHQLGGAEILQTVAAGASAPALAVNPLLRYRGETRTATLATLADDQVTTKFAKPSEAELEALHKEKAALFTAPEYRALSFAVLSAKGLAASIKATDKELRDAYDSRTDDFVVPERRTVEQIRFDNEAAAKAAKDKLAGGADFLALAKDAGQKPDVTSLGENAQADLPPAFAVAFKLAQNEVSEPVKSDFGWHLLRATNIKPGHTDEFDAVKSKVEKDLIEQKSIDALYDRANKLDTVLDSGASLEDAARQLGLEMRKVEAVSRTGKAPDGSDVKDLPAAVKLLGAAFELKAGQTGRPVEVREENLYFVVRADSVTEPALRPLSDVLDQAIRVWEGEQRAKEAKTRADALAEKVKAGLPLESIAKEAKLAVSTTPSFTRDGRGAGGLPPGAVQPLFAAAAPGAVAVARSADDKGWVVAQLKTIEAVDPEKDKLRRDQVAKTVKDGVEGDLIKQFDQALRQRFPVKIDRKAVDAIY